MQAAVRPSALMVRWADLSWGADTINDRSSVRHAGGAKMTEQRRINRRQFLSTAAALGGAGLLAACQPPSGAAPIPTAGRSASSNPEWDRVLAAARQEGVINLYGGSGQGNQDAMVEPFQTAFPGIKVNGTFGLGRDLVARIGTERTAGKNIADVLIGPGASGIFPLKPIGALAAISPVLMLDEVTDTSKWLENKIWYIDAEEPLTTIGFEGDVNVTVTINTDMIDPSGFTSYFDLLDPKWKGKMCCSDVRLAGAGAVPMRYFWVTPGLGPIFIQRLFTETDLTLSADSRQLIDWVARAEYPVGLMLNSVDVVPAIAQGLPLIMVKGDQFKEGAPLGPSGGTVSLVDSGPNPNAATVFVNWLLSRDGQLSWQNHVHGNSTRIDIPKDAVTPAYLPVPGHTYLDCGSEKYAALSTSDIGPFIANMI